MPSSDYLYDIEVLGFRDMRREDAVVGLMKTFGIDDDHAGKMFDRIPVRVRTRATDVETERYVRSLLRIGAEVRVTNGPHVRVYMPEDLLNPSPQPPPASGVPSRQWDETSPPSSTVPPQSPGLPESARKNPPSPSEHSQPPAVSSAENIVPEDRENVGRQIETAICPQCAFEQQKSERCVRCGAVLESDPYDLIRLHTRQEPAVSGDGSAPAGPLFRRSSIGASPFVVSLGDDDGLFADGRRTFDPGGMLQGRLGSGSFSSVSNG